MQIPLLVIIVLNVLFSLKGFKDPAFFRRYMLQIGPVLRDKDYKRLITSSFLHMNWGHLIFEMTTLYFFAMPLLVQLGLVTFLSIYLGSMLVAALFSVLYHRRDYAYSAVGASGAVTGVLFSSLLLYPIRDIVLFPFPIPIPGFFFGMLYLLYAVFSIKQNRGKISHTDHMAGAASGMIIMLLREPYLFDMRWKAILFVIFPIAFFFYIFYSNELFDEH